MGGWEDGRMGGWEDGRMGGWSSQKRLMFILGISISDIDVFENVQETGAKITP